MSGIQVNEAYRDVSERMESFDDCPPYCPVNMIHLAKSGFYYASREEFIFSVTCFGCSKDVDVWSKGDIPSRQRFHEFGCSFVKQTDGLQGDPNIKLPSAKPKQSKISSQSPHEASVAQHISEREDISPSADGPDDVAGYFCEEELYGEIPKEEEAEEDAELIENEQKFVATMEIVRKNAEKARNQGWPRQANWRGSAALPSSSPQVLPYEITVKTGDKRNAGTDANVTLQIYGEDGKSEAIKLGNKTDIFERDTVDKFKIESRDVGPITKIRIGHDGKGLGSGWFLDSVKVQRFVQETSKRKKRPRGSATPDRQDIETYWFVCKRWLDKDEDDGQIILELVPTDESGQPIDEALQQKEYSVHMFTGDKFGAGTDADVYLTLYGENGDSGERILDKSEINLNKFERNQEDIFKFRAADLGQIKKLKIRRNDAITGAGWYLDRVLVRSDEIHAIFPCQRWLSTSEDDGEIQRTLVPVSEKTYQRLQSEKTGKSEVCDAIAVETKAQVTRYEVVVITGDIRGGGTEANVYMMMFGDNDNSVKINLNSRISAYHQDPFGRARKDVFTVESTDLGNLKKIKIGHDNVGSRPGWYLESVDIDAPSMGLKWHFPCGRWLDKDEDDGLLERELLPATDDTITYATKVPYEISVTTSDIPGARTDADVYVVIFGRDGISTEQASLCTNKDDRKRKYFKRNSTDTFVLELEDIGDTIEKIRIGHNGKGFGVGWHLDKVQVRRLMDGEKGSETYLFPCNRWLALDEDDGKTVLELAPVKKVEEKVYWSGKMERRKSAISDNLKSPKYRVHVFTGDRFSAGTDANVYITLFGDNGNSGERQLWKSETHSDKFEKGHEDIFPLEAVNLGKLYKVHIRHDNSFFNPPWFLQRVEVEDCETSENFVFHCERWLARNKDDKKIERSLYVVGYDGETSTNRSLMTGRSFGRKFSRKFMSDSMPEGPTMPYHIKIHTGSVEGGSSSADGFVRMYGPKSKGGQKITHRIPLIPPNGKFKQGTVESFSVEALDVGEIKEIEVGHTGVDDCWFIKEVVIDLPTLGKNLVFECLKWFARFMNSLVPSSPMNNLHYYVGREDGLTSRRFGIEDAKTSEYKPKTPPVFTGDEVGAGTALRPRRARSPSLHVDSKLTQYEISVVTSDEKGSGTDAEVTVTIYGENSNSGPRPLKQRFRDLFERGRTDKFTLEFFNVGELTKLQVEHDDSGFNSDWLCDHIIVKDTSTGRSWKFPCCEWIGGKKGKGQLVRELLPRPL